jgi:hypothetical protein
MLAKLLDRNKIPKGKISAAGTAFLKAQKVPAKIARELARCTFDGMVEFGSARLFSLAALPAMNKRFGFRRALKNGFLIIGEGPSGDAIAVELKNGEVAFLSHDVLLEFDPECNTFAECVARSKLQMAVFFERSDKEKDFPCDFYGAGGGG